MCCYYCQFCHCYKLFALLIRLQFCGQSEKQRGSEKHEKFGSEKHEKLDKDKKDKDKDKEKEEKGYHINI